MRSSVRKADRDDQRRIDADGGPLLNVCSRATVSNFHVSLCTEQDPPWCWRELCCHGLIELHGRRIAGPISSWRRNAAVSYPRIRIWGYVLVTEDDVATGKTSCLRVERENFLHFGH